MINTLIRMKRDNCVEVKYVNNLSVPYLSRFFGSVGPIVKIEKEDVSKYVTIVRYPGCSNLRIKIVLKGPSASMGESLMSAPSKSEDASPKQTKKAYQFWPIPSPRTLELKPWVPRLRTHGGWAQMICGALSSVN